jgi:hypothetical protein
MKVRDAAMLAVLAFASACGSSGGSPSDASAGAGANGGGGNAGNFGSTGAAGTGTTGAAGNGGNSGNGGNGGSSGAAGHVGSGAAGSAKTDGGAADAGGADANGAYGGIAGLEDLSPIKSSAGCGKEPGQPLGSWQLAPAGANKYMFGYALSTPNTPKGSFTRRYFVLLPKTYDKNKPHRVVYEGPKCGSVGYEVPAFDTAASAPNAADDPHGDGVIQVGLTPDPTVWMAGCFDDHAGAETIEKAFIEALWPLVAASFCIDEHRVFLAGYDSGARLANQLGHVYGSRLFRAISPSAGGLAVGASTLQPCLATGLPGSATTVGGCLPVPGMWWHDADDTVDAFAGTQQAIEAALLVNRCANATFMAGPGLPFATLPHAMCVSYSTCPTQFPVVLCTAHGQDHNNLLDEPANLAAAWAFFKAF